MNTKEDMIARAKHLEDKKTFWLARIACIKQSLLDAEKIHETFVRESVGLNAEIERMTPKSAFEMAAEATRP